MLSAADCVSAAFVSALLIRLTALGAAALWPGATAAPAANLASSAPSVARNLRSHGCGGHVGIATALRDNRSLNAAALQWSRGANLKAAVEQSGYREQQSAALHVSGDASAMQRALTGKLCAELSDPSFIDLGSFQRGHDTWIIIAAPFAPPARSDADAIARELLLRINLARAQPRRCGTRAFAAAPALQPSPLLRLAAAAHAQDMLSHDYFAHQGRDGSTPAQRVTTTGYRYQVVGENIASGPESAADAAAGWLASPAHCENIMDPRFRESGIAYAASGNGTPRIYWVQEFAAPRASAPPRDLEQ
ncbi:MAG: CAP domain-containing protein [Steroidobacterales bacterium]